MPVRSGAPLPLFRPRKAELELGTVAPHDALGIAAVHRIDLHLGVLRQTRADGQLGLISGRTGNADAAAGVKYVDDHLLQALIAVGLRCVQRIERVKQRGERRSKQGVWEGDFAERDVRRSKIARVLPPIEILV